MKAFVLFGLLTGCASLQAQEEMNWWQTQKELTRLLLEEDREITEVLAEQMVFNPQSHQDHLFRLCVMIRAGVDAEAVAEMRALRNGLEDPRKFEVSGIYHFLCEDVKAWDPAKALVNLFAEEVYDLSLQSGLIEHWVKTGVPFGEIDLWLRRKPAGINNFWRKQRLLFYQSQKREQELIRQYVSAVKKHPGDVEQAIEFLDMLTVVGRERDADWSLNWMAKRIRPKLATQAAAMAEDLMQLHENEAAIHFYEVALAIPLTDEEIDARASRSSMWMEPKEMRRIIQPWFEVDAQETIAEAYKALNNPEEAQAWMVKAADLREEHHLGMNPRLAGQVQLFTGQRIIEGRIKEKEELSKDDPEYWTERAEYYRGRKEAEPEEQALLTGLALLDKKIKVPESGKDYAYERRSLLGTYTHFLQRQKREEEAVALLRDELTFTPEDPERGRNAARNLAYNFPKFLRADDEVLWQWLAQEASWDYAGERMIWSMFKNTDPKNRDAAYRRAGKIVDEQGPENAYNLGWVLNRMGEPKRSLPFLMRAMEESEKAEHRERGAYTLYESYIDLGDWKSAEEVFPLAARRLTSSEIPERMARLAVVTAETGAKKDAMRIWQRTVNVAPYQTDGLEELVAAGLKQELREFYNKLQKQMPASEIPARMLSRLE